MNIAKHRGTNGLWIAFGLVACSVSSGGDDTGQFTGTETDSAGTDGSICGDSIVGPSEECDEGDDNDNEGTCTEQCTEAKCGDGYLQQGEECDDGDEDNHNACTLACVPPQCGDGFIQEELDEQCDDGAENNDYAACTAACQVAYCGDGLKQTDVEACDDGKNGDNEDLCTDICQFPMCGDGFVQVTLMEVCDDANEVDGDACNTDCINAGLWTRTHDGPADSGSYDRGQDIATDSAGNVVVIGFEYVVGESYNIWLRKYDPDGEELWTTSYNSLADGEDWGLAVAVNSDDEIVAVGYENVAGEAKNNWIRKYSSGGNEVWTSRYDVPGNFDDIAYDVGTDSDGNIVVAGSLSGQSQNAWVAKFSPGGTQLWDAVQAGDHEARGVTADASGSVIVTGFQIVSADNEDIWVRKYDADGNESWTDMHDDDAAANSFDRGYAVTTDGRRNIIVTGSVSIGEDDNNKDAWIRKYDPDGAEIWTTLYTGPGIHDEGFSVATDGSDNVVLSGYQTVAPSKTAVWVGKYDPDGVRMWTSSHHAAETLDTDAKGVAVDSRGHVVTAGSDQTASNDVNIWVRKFLP